MTEWLSEAMAQADVVFREFSFDWQFSFNQAATEEEISRCEAELALTLPQSYREFLLRHNGAHLFCSNAGNRSDSHEWWADSGIVIFGTKVLRAYRPSIRDYFLYDDDSDAEDYPSVLPIAYLGRIGTGDFCALNRDQRIGNEHPVIDCDHELLPSEWKAAMIAVSFEDWLRKMFDAVIYEQRFPEYWIGQEYPDATFEGYKDI